MKVKKRILRGVRIFFIGLFFLLIWLGITALLTFSLVKLLGLFMIDFLPVIMIGGPILTMLVGVAIFAAVVDD
ncbi:hypothetical protein ACSYAD_34710 [Acaryochloris marina NIES-2412]|uniref:hypothetical protein n=1 Tax=Acaryochloris marina TaxID=155978 RepID=UPI00405A0C6F